VLAEVSPFDPELLPETLRPWVLDVVERLEVPSDYLAAALIVMLAGAIGRRASLTFTEACISITWSSVRSLPDFTYARRYH
jgi:hypothetical protein